MIVAFTGHRPDKLGGFQPNMIQTFVRLELKNALIKLRATKVITGMALGVDQWAAMACDELDIPYIAAVPQILERYFCSTTEK